MECGFKCNIIDIQDSIGIHQLQKVDKYWKHREEIWFRYLDVLNGLSITLTAETQNETKNGYHLLKLILEIWVEKI